MSTKADKVDMSDPIDDLNYRTLPPEPVADRLEQIARVLGTKYPKNNVWRVIMQGATRIRTLEAKLAALSPKKDP